MSIVNLTKGWVLTGYHVCEDCEHQEHRYDTLFGGDPRRQRIGSFS